MNYLIKKIFSKKIVVLEPGEVLEISKETLFLGAENLGNKIDNIKGNGEVAINNVCCIKNNMNYELKSTANSKLNDIGWITIENYASSISRLNKYIMFLYWLMDCLKVDTIYIRTYCERILTEKKEIEEYNREEDEDEE